MGNEFISYLESGVNVPVGSWTLQPLAGLRYLLLAQGAFGEYGGGAADLAVGSQNFDSLRYSIGARFTRFGGLSAGSWTPYLEGRWTHEVLSNERLVDARLRGHHWRLIRQARATRWAAISASSVRGSRANLSSSRLPGVRGLRLRR